MALLGAFMEDLIMKNISKILFENGVNLVTIAAINAAVLYIPELEKPYLDDFIKKYGVMSWLEIQDLLEEE